MEAAICTLVSQFKTFAGNDGPSSTLSKEEFHDLVTSQLPNFVKVDPEGWPEPNAAVTLPNRFLSRSFPPLWIIVMKCSLLFGSGGAERPASIQPVQLLCVLTQ